MAVSKQSTITSGQAKVVVLKPCGCGCGLEVRRNFAPGHDARHKGNLLRRFDEGDVEAGATLVENGWKTQDRLDERRAKAEAKVAAREAAKEAKAAKGKEAVDA